MNFEYTGQPEEAADYGHDRVLLKVAREYPHVRHPDFSVLTRAP